MTDRPSTWAQQMNVAGLPNLWRVSPTLFRSARPTDLNALIFLCVKTEIDLEEFHVGYPPAGIQLVHLGMEPWHPEIEDCAAFLKAATNPANLPALVHCYHGSDRTGLMCCIYRMAVQGWARQDAVDEMQFGGFGFNEMWQDLVDFALEVDVFALCDLAGIARPIQTPNPLSVGVSRMLNVTDLLKQAETQFQSLAAQFAPTVATMTADEAQATLNLLLGGNVRAGMDAVYAKMSPADLLTAGVALADQADADVDASAAAKARRDAIEKAVVGVLIGLLTTAIMAL